MGNASERRFSFLLSLEIGYSVFDLDILLVRFRGSFLLDIPRDSVGSRFLCGLCAFASFFCRP